MQRRQSLASARSRCNLQCIVSSTQVPAYHISNQTRTQFRSANFPCLLHRRCAPSTSVDSRKLSGALRFIASMPGPDPSDEAALAMPPPSTIPRATARPSTRVRARKTTPEATNIRRHLDPYTLMFPPSAEMMKALLQYGYTKAQIKQAWMLPSPDQHPIAPSPAPAPAPATPAPAAAAPPAVAATESVAEAVAPKAKKSRKRKARAIDADPSAELEHGPAKRANTQAEDAEAERHRSIQNNMTFCLDSSLNLIHGPAVAAVPPPQEMGTSNELGWETAPLEPAAPAPAPAPAPAQKKDKGKGRAIDNPPAIVSAPVVEKPLKRQRRVKQPKYILFEIFLCALCLSLSSAIAGPSRQVEMPSASGSSLVMPAFQPQQYPDWNAYPTANMDLAGYYAQYGPVPGPSAGYGPQSSYAQYVDPEAGATASYSTDDLAGTSQAYQGLTVDPSLVNPEAGIVPLPPYVDYSATNAQAQACEGFDQLDSTGQPLDDITNEFLLRSGLIQPDYPGAMTGEGYIEDLQDAQLAHRSHELFGLFNIS
ncbi:unnamed protein product [Mycena citricolor]|uniref:Uncharacterized protein n=1 Tax=Mycena citricolor TaxID=2018698 RepID=A0AAD2GZH6_9AGAR|nr:unnamed protein product [Mycena citricolor]